MNDQSTNNQPFHGDFLKNLPCALNAEQRIAFEAINITLDMAELKYRQIEARLDLYETKDKVLNMSLAERILLFSDIWGFIDQAYALNRLLYQSAKKGEKKELFDFSTNLEGSKTAQIIEKHYNTYHEVLCVLRNRMDHLPDNLQSLAGKKASEAPLYGTLAYTLTNSEELTEKKLVRVVLLTCSPYYKEKHTYDGINPCDFNTYSHPTDHLQLSAFGRKISLTKLYASIKEVKESINTDMAQIFYNAIKKYADKNGISKEEAFKTPPGEVALVLEGFLASKEEIEALNLTQKILD